MTDTAKTTSWMIIILILVGGIWWFIGSNPESQVPTVAPVQQFELQATTTEVSAVIEDASTSISVQDNSDEALTTDLSKVDDQIKALNTTSAN
ncbi:MAG: hypothetical protein WCQ00_00110 [bacterium]